MGRTELRGESRLNVGNTLRKAVVFEPAKPGFPNQKPRRTLNKVMMKRTTGEVIM